MSIISNTNRVIIKDVEFKSPNELLSKFIEKVEPRTYKFIEKGDSLIGTTDDEGNKMLLMTKVTVMAVLDNQIGPNNEYREVIGISYAIDVRKPHYKIWKAYMNMEDNFLIMLDPMVEHYEFDIDDQTIELSYLDVLLDKPVNILPCLEVLSETIERNEVEEIIGKALINSLETSFNFGFGKIKLATSYITKLYNTVYNNKDGGSFAADANGNSNMLSYYGVLSNLIFIDTKDVINLPDKILLTITVAALKPVAYL